MPSHDPSYRQFFSQPRMVRELLQAFVHEDWVAELDFGTLEQVNTHFVAKHLRKRESDVIWRVRRRQAGTDEWLYLYLLLEFQSQPNPRMALRMWVYVGRLYQQLARRKEYRRKPLPPVFPLVLYNGIKPWHGVQEVAELIEAAPGDLGRYQPRMRYLLLDESKLTDALSSAAEGNLAAALVCMENAHAPDELRALVQLLYRWACSPEDQELREAFRDWLLGVKLPDKLAGEELPENIKELEEIDAMLAERVKQWTQEWKREGQVIERSEFLRRQMVRKYGPLSAEHLARLEQADPGQLLIWGERILFATTPEEMFGG